jgi:hypothetical protein
MLYPVFPEGDHVLFSGVLFSVCHQPVIPGRLTCRQIGEIKQSSVHELRGGNMPHRTGDVVNSSRKLHLPLPEHSFDFNSLQMILRAAQIAGDDRELT